MLATLVLSMLLVSGPNPGPPQINQVDAMVTWMSNKVFIFSGAYCYRFDLTQNTMDEGYPKPIASVWAGLPFQRIDAAVNFENGKIYFFSGNLYASYDVENDATDRGYPQYINPAWNLPWNQVDAAVNWNNGYVYFFNNAASQFVRYRIGANAPDGGPQSIASKWRGFPFPNVGGACAYMGHAYFAQGNSFSRYTLPTGAYEAGYPKDMAFFPDVAGGPAVAPSYTPAAPNNRPAATTYAPPSPPAPQSNATCRIDGTLVYAESDEDDEVVYRQWNNVSVQLQMANAYFSPRYSQYISQGYTPADAMNGCVREDNLWTPTSSVSTKPTTLQSGKYGMNFSWFVFANFNPGVYRVVVPGYPTLNRWVSFTSGGQKLDVNLEYP